jgi:hypothetical protein
MISQLSQNENTKRVALSLNKIKQDAASELLIRETQKLFAIYTDL